MRVGIFGGTFNPIHRGHLHIAEQVLRCLSLDRVVFVPSGEPPHKKGETLVQRGHRLEMVRLAVESHPRFEVSDVEVRRSGPSYSVDTIRLLQEKWGAGAELFFILGIDAFLDVMNWKDPDILFTLCHFAVISRPGYAFADLKGLPPLRTVSPALLAALDMGERTSLEVPLGEHRLYLQRVAPSPISATDLRRRIAESEDLRNLLPDAVASYIMGKQLYHHDPSRGKDNGQGAQGKNRRSTHHHPPH